MTIFRYRAVSGVGDVVAGELDAASRSEAVRQLRERSLDPLSLTEGARSSLIELLNRDITFGRGGRLRLRLNFARDLAVLRDAGAPLDQALAILGEGADAAAELARRVGQRSSAGMALSEALAAEPRIFDDATVALVAAGEASGDMAEALRTLADLTEESIATRGEMLKSLLYPAALILAALMAIGLMVFHVLPSFESLFAGAGETIPQSARMVFRIGHVARAAALPMAVALPLLAVAMALAWASKRGRQTVDLLLLRLPLVGRMVAGLDLGRAMLVAGRLLNAGATADRAFELASQTCTNWVFRHDLRASAGRIRDGAAVAPSLAAVRFVPQRALRMIAIGEAAGSLPRMLAEVAKMQQDGARAGVKALLAALPPILTVVIGMLVAGLIYAVLTALLSINELAF